VKLKLRVGRWRCRNRICRRQIFCQRLERVAKKQAMETRRYDEIVRQVAYAVGGRPGERLMRHLGLRCSKNTLLRRIKRWARFRPSAESISAVGVDEWAWRKGYGNYGTILVDLERRQVVDLLGECSAAAFEGWLRQHPKVRIISRDRQGLLAEGGQAGAPQAAQVADRFHLIQNLQQAVQLELTCQRAHLSIPPEEFVRPSETKEVPIGAMTISQPRRVRRSPIQDEVRQQRWQHKLELFQRTKSMRAQGFKVSDIMRQAGISRGLADKWLRLEECPPRAKRTSPPGMAEDFREELWARWEQGQQEGKQLFVEIRERGYVGSYASLMRFLGPWRAARAAGSSTSRASKTIHPEPARHVSPRLAVALLSKPKPLLNHKQSEMVAILKRRCPGFATMRHLVLSFRSILCSGKVSSLKRWAAKAEASGIEMIVRFVRQLKKDWAAVENAVEQVWSNGPTEGHINRLKTLKRGMYGRAGVELLRARLLPLAA
jgi:transposase